MVKLLVFAILLASSPASGLLETLFRAENICYTGCYSNYAADHDHLNACRKGCDFTLHRENCADQCKSTVTDEKMCASCQVGCTLSVPTVQVGPQKPIVAVEPISENKVSDVVPADVMPERPRSIILIRLRQRPSLDMPSAESFFNSDPVQMFNNMLKQFQEKAGDFEQSIRKSFDENGKEYPTLSVLPKSFPIIRLPANIRADSSSESSEERSDRRPLVDELRHVIKHPREHEQYLRERMQPVKNRFQQFFADVRSEWYDLVRKQPKIPVWIFLAILLTSSAILWYMVMSLCRHTPSRDALSVRAQELVYNPYEYEGFEKEKIQPEDQAYNVADALPIKVKLSNI